MGSTGISDRDLDKCPICTSASDFQRTAVCIATGQVYLRAKCSGYFLFPNEKIEYNGSGWTGFRKQNWQKDVQRGYAFARSISAHVRARLGRPLKSVLEIGCGSAFMGPGFESLGVSYRGVDVDSESVALANNNGLEVYCVPAEELACHVVSQRQYDLVLSSNTFEHLANPPRVFHNLRGLSRGIIVIVVPNPHGLFARLRANRFFSKAIQLYSGNTRQFAYAIDGCWHAIAYSRDTLEHLARRAGLSVEEIRPMNKNDETFGFVQPNRAFSYLLASKFADALGMSSELILFARPKRQRISIS